MKISAFHLMPHRELPADFEKRYPSVWVTPPWWELADPARAYGALMQNLAHAGFDADIKLQAAKANWGGAEWGG